MEKESLQEYYQTLGNALQQFKGALDTYKTVIPEHKEYLRSATIHSFEFSIEVYWKFLKKFLAFNKIITTSPRETMQKAFQSYLINNEAVWLAMLNDRNATSHTYRECVAQEVLERIKKHYAIMEETYAKLGQQLEKL